MCDCDEVLYRWLYPSSFVAADNMLPNPKCRTQVDLSASTANTAKARRNGVPVDERRAHERICLKCISILLILMVCISRPSISRQTRYR